MRGLEQIPWLYDALAALQDRTGLVRWRRWLAQGARGRVLDLGTGTGRMLPHYPPNLRVVGLDPSPAVLNRARRRSRRALLVVGRAESLPFRDEAFDTVVGSLVLCSVADPGRALAEVRRVLGPGGELRVVEHVRSARPWRARVQDWIQPAWTHVTGGCHPNRETEAAVERAGFRILPDGRRARGDMRRFAARPA
ncbi:MAG TPA: methyltransferase domain-containing protein [Candidatus Binatia bacterium]|nr:methyltransferase domain-containing protein [Candidatus Binatia bacterium]